MILQIAYEIRFFLLVLFCVLLGFTQALWLLSNKQSDLPWGTMKEGFLTSFLFMLGAGDVDPLMTGTVAPALGTLLLVLFMMIMIILMLNLLIALMGDTFANVRAQGLAVWRKEQASIIVEESFFFHKKMSRIKPYLHVLRYTSEVGNVDDEENLSYQESPLVKLVEMARASVMEFTDLPEESNDSKG